MCFMLTACGHPHVGLCHVTLGSITLIFLWTSYRGVNGYPGTLFHIITRAVELQTGTRRSAVVTSIR